jgi:hypothetical protein
LQTAPRSNVRNWQKFIHLILPHKSISILLLKQQMEHWRAMWVTIVGLVPVGYIFKKAKWRKVQYAQSLPVVRMA